LPRRASGPRRGQGHPANQPLSTPHRRDLHMLHTRITRSSRQTAAFAVVLTIIGGSTRVTLIGRGSERPWSAPQAASPGPASTPTGSGLIVGRVVDASSDAPVGDAIVTLVLSPASAADSLSPQRVMVDSRGRFLLHDLPKGTVTLGVSADGYMAGGYGQLRPNGAAVPLELGEGQRVSDVTIRLWRFAALGGTIVDEFGDPVVGVPVRVLQALRGTGPRRVIAAAKAATDDRGAFRVSSLEPGDYIVAVPTTATSIPTAAGEDPSKGLGNGDGPLVPLALAARESRYETTFYPGETMASQAEIITLGSGEERSGVDVALRLVRTFSVSGSVWGPDGPASSFALHLVPANTADWADQGGLETARTLTDGQGRFTFLGVPPGEYLLQGTALSPVTVPDGPGAGPMAAAQPANRAIASVTSLWGQTRVGVDEGNVTGVSLVLREGLSVGGRLRFEGSSQPPSPDQLQQLSIGLVSATGTSLGPEPPGRIAADGRFTIRGYLPGEYALDVSSPDRPWTLMSIAANGHDLLGAPLALDADVTGVVITFTDRPTELNGAVHSSSQQHKRLVVVVFPADYAAAMDKGMLARRSRCVPPSATGQFIVDGLPAGDYLAAAIPSDLASNWMDPDFIAVIAPQAARVSLAEGDRKTVDPRVVVIR
jgi:hypothetical protein